MDRIGLGQVVNTSFSLHSAAEGSEIISEAEEIQEVYNLQSRGSRALQSADYDDALRCYEDALEIDEYNVDSLCGRAGVYLEQGRYVLAQIDAEKVLAIQAQNSTALSLQGEALGQLGYHREALVAFLKALEQELDSDEACDLLSESIVAMADKYCTVPERVTRRVQALTSYKRLCEVGAALYTAKRHDLCIRVLTTAQQLQTPDQTPVTRKVLLTLANAHSALKHGPVALSLYKSCLSSAEGSRDVPYQTKSLVSLASLCLELGETHRAIVYYRRLLAIHESEAESDSNDAGREPTDTADPQASKEPPPAPHPSTLWTPQLLCALHLNLSVAYQSVGAVRDAVRHAETYKALITGREILRANAEAVSYHNLGVLSDVLGEYEAALKHYEQFLALSRTKKDKRGIAQAYGCLGNAHAKLHNIALAKTFSEQAVNTAKALGEDDAVTQAHETFGDTLMYLEVFDEASEQFLHMFHACPKSDRQTRTKSLCKIGKAYRLMNKPQYSLYYLEQAKVIADDFKLSAMRTLCEFNLALVLQLSGQVKELAQALGYLERLIPQMEAKVWQHRIEGTFCGSELKTELAECYRAAQCIHVKLGESNQALVYAERARTPTEAEHDDMDQGDETARIAAMLEQTEKKKSEPSRPRGKTMECIEKEEWKRTSKIASKLEEYELNKSKFSKSTAMKSSGLQVISESPSKTESGDVESLRSIVDKQSSTVVYYSVLGDSYLVWILMPGRGVVRFYHKQEESLKSLVAAEILKLKGPEGCGSHQDDLGYESRCLPVRDEGLKLARKQNQKLAQKGAKDDKSQKPGENQKEDPGKPLLFRLLLSTVYDALSDLPAGSPVTFIPDSYLCACPFGALVDWSGQSLADRFTVTVASSLRSVGETLLSEERRAKKKEAMEGEKVKSRPEQNEAKNDQPKTEMKQDKLGINDRKVKIKKDSTKTNSNSSKKSPGLNPKCVSNPQLVTRGPVTRSVTKETNSVTTLTAHTATDTSIMTSTSAVTPHRQVCDGLRAVVIGNPALPASVQLHQRAWRPSLPLHHAQAECSRIAEHFSVAPITGKEATKERFLTELQNAAVIHIATRMCLREGYLVFAPSDPAESDPPEESYIVTMEELSRLELSAKLVVLSGGWGVTGQEMYQEGYPLPTALIKAGAQCVLSLLWPLPDCAVQKFYHHLYTGLAEGGEVSGAVRGAMAGVRDDNRFSAPTYWLPWLLIGRDTHLNLREMRHTTLDQTLNRLEGQVGRGLGKARLNPGPSVTKAPSLEVQLSSVQHTLASILLTHDQQPAVLGSLRELLSFTLALADAAPPPRVLPACLTDHQGALGLLGMLGYHFTARGAEMTEPYVIGPHWDPGELGVRALRAIHALAAIVIDPKLTSAIQKMLSVMTPDQLSYLVDLLCVTLNAPDLPLKVTDASVRPLWADPKVKVTLTEAGYHQVGTLISFHRTQGNIAMLTSCLQLCLALSAHKNPAMLHKLDVTMLGTANHKGDSSPRRPSPRDLPTLSPVRSPRQQIQMTTPWMSRPETPADMAEKMKLAKSQGDIKREYRHHLQRMNSFHECTLGAQANENLNLIGRPRSSPSKVKVKAGQSQSSGRVLESDKPRLSLLGTNQRRDYMNYVLKERRRLVNSQQKEANHNIYLPYIKA